MRVLLDERSQPPLRAVIGALLGSAREADIAVMHVRIAALDLHADELTHLRKCRILLGKLDAQALMATGPVSANRTDRVAALLRFLRSGTVEIRSAGMSAWSTDFSVYRGITGGSTSPSVCLVGAHYFQEPPVRGGPTFTWAVDEPAAVRRATQRFEEVWQESHDVLLAVIHTIEQFTRGVA
jgi:hypothetical protein